MKILVIAGTRPEAIKLAPVILNMRNKIGNDCIVCSSGQHRDLLPQAFSDFNIEVQENLNVMTDNQGLAELTAKLIIACDNIITKIKPDWILVQGDTSTVFCASLAAFYRKVKIGHIEAGLRSHDRYSPYPEEINRKLTSELATLHFAPTETAKVNLLKEGIDNNNIIVTGNTVVDAANYILNRYPHIEFNTINLNDINKKIAGKNIVVVTCHRRENFGTPLIDIVKAIKYMANRNKNLVIIFPVHPNPNIKGFIYSELNNESNILLVPPISYREMIHLLSKSIFVMTDSGGLQEECAALNVPVLILRDTTERHEGIQAGFAKLIGTDFSKIIYESQLLIESKELRDEMCNNVNPYGDGLAAERIASAILKR